MHSANLIVPQVQVKWGDVDLTDPASTGIPSTLVYDVTVEMAAQSQWPTGSMMWSPAGKAFDKFIEFSKKYEEDISVRFYYQNGPEITFYFQYAGMQMDYGNSMGVKVYLNCIKAETASASKKSFAIDNAETFKAKGKDQLQVEKKITELYGGKEVVPKVIWSKCAEKGAKKVKIQQAYAKDSTYGTQIQQLAQDGGNTITYSNMTKEGVMIVQCPLTWQAKNSEGDIKIPGKTVVEGERYGWLLGPGIIDSFSREFRWQSPSQDNNQSATPASQPQGKADALKPPGTTDQAQQKRVAKAQGAGKAPAGSTTPNAQRNKSTSENPEAGEKKQFLTEENQTQISAELFMTPSMVGITPDDVLYIPSLDPKKDIIEDYKVTSVSYTQSGAEFRVSVQGNRPYGINKPMWEDAAKKFREIARKLTTVADWTKYAWTLNRGSSAPAVATAPSSKTGSTQAARKSK